MSDELLAALRPWVGDQDFRADAAKFMSLSRQAVDTMVALITKHGTFSLPAGAIADFERTSQLWGEGSGVLAAAELIRPAARRIPEGDARNQGLSGLAAIVGANDYVTENFSGFFSDLPKLEMAELRSTAIAIAPTLVGVTMTSDLRVVSDPPNIQCALVPVVFARLAFDEPVAGQRAHFVQLTEESLAELEREIDKMKELRRTIDRRFASDIMRADDQ